MLQQINQIFGRLLDRFLPTSKSQVDLRNLLVKATGGTYLIQVTILGVGFLTNVILARILGDREYGLYTYALSWSAIFVIPGIFGLNRYLVRETSINRATGDWTYFQGLLIFAFGSTGIITGLIVALAHSLPYWLPIPIADPDKFIVVRTALFLASILSFGTLISAVLRGLNRIIISQVPNIITYAISNIVVLFVAGVFWEADFRALDAVWVRICLGIVSTIVGVTILLRNIEVWSPVKWRFSYWLRSIPYFSWIGIVTTIYERADFIILGALRPLEEVGWYSAAYVLGTLVVQFLTIINRVASPTFAELHALNKIRQLEALAVKSSTVLFLLTSPIILLLIIFGRPILGLYGPGFHQAYNALVIIVLGQTVNLATGTVGNILVMTGNERLVASINSATLLINLICNIVLIPVLGILGAAIAWSVSLCVGNISQAIIIKRKMGIHTTIAGNFSRQSG